MHQNLCSSSSSPLPQFHLTPTRSTAPLDSFTGGGTRSEVSFGVDRCAGRSAAILAPPHARHVGAAAVHGAHWHRCQHCSCRISVASSPHTLHLLPRLVVILTCF